MKEEFTRPEQGNMLNLEKSDASLGKLGEIVIRTTNHIGGSDVVPWVKGFVYVFCILHSKFI